MSKMGRYVFNLQETADADSNRQAHPRSEADEDTRSTIGNDGDWRQLSGTYRREQPRRGTGAETESEPLATWDDIPF